MDKTGKKGDLTQRLTNKLMIVYQIPGRETFDKMCLTIDQLFDLSPSHRGQADYPFKSDSAILYGLNHPAWKADRRVQ